MPLSPELEQYYEEQFSMMATQGWKDMCEELEATSMHLKDITTTTPDTLLNRQGRVAELSFILNRRPTLSRAYEDLQNGS